MERQAGLTLVEMLTVMAVTAILLAIGVPSYKYVTNSNRMYTEAGELLGDLQFARTEAAREGLPITVCISSDGASCLTGATSWSNGWIVFVDHNGDQTVDTGDVVLRVQTSFSSSDTFTDNASLAAVTFNREGFASNLGGTSALFTLHDSTSNRAWTRCLYLAVQGNMGVSTPATLSSCT
jgi:type IV fimbrial biogenesis protein FimT